LISSVLFTSNSTGVAIDSLEILSTPEPAGLALVLPALAALAILRKRR
jgi:MYXO-CTERM domain-containing protein